MSNGEASSDSPGGKKTVRLEVGGLPIPLRRTFAALDRLIATPIEALSDRVEARFRQNVESHIEVVKKKREKAGKTEALQNSSVGTARTFAEWVDVAGEIEPEDQELSAVWRATLDHILSEPNDARDLLRTVKALTRADIKRFLDEFADEPFPAWKSRGLKQLIGDTTVYLHLRNQGLIRRTMTWPVSFLYLYIGVTLFYLARTEMGIEYPPLILASVIWIMAYFAIMPVFVVTPLGSTLAKLYREYHENKDK